MSASLFLIASEYRSAAATLEDLDMPEDVVQDTLESISGDLEQKSQNVAMFIRNLEATAEQIKEHAKAMIERAKAMEARATRIRQYLLDGLTLAQRDKIETPYFKIKIALNPPSVKIENEALVPGAYMTEPTPPAPQPDRKLIAAALKDGFEIPGCSLVRGRRLDIR